MVLVHRVLEHRNIVPGILVLALLAFPLHAQSQSASLQGIVRDPEGKAISGATVELHRKDAAGIRTVVTDVHGAFKFTPLMAGVYNIRTTKIGFDDASTDLVFLASNETKSIDLKLVAAKKTTSESAPQFFDPPQFTVSGVTDTTALGGHAAQRHGSRRGRCVLHIQEVHRAQHRNQPDLRRMRRRRICRYRNASL